MLIFYIFNINIFILITLYASSLYKLRLALPKKYFLAAFERRRESREKIFLSGGRRNLYKLLAYYITKEKIKEGEKEGGILPLLTLIPLIAGGVSAAGAAAGGTAGIVKAVNGKQAADEELAEQRWHNLEMEKRWVVTWTSIFKTLFKRHK